MAEPDELVIEFSIRRCKCQLCRERLNEPIHYRLTRQRKTVPLCKPCYEGLVLANPNRLNPLLSKSVKFGRAVSPNAFARLYVARFGHPAIKCACGCGRYTRSPANCLPEHRPGGSHFDESHRLGIAEPQRYEDALIVKANRLYDKGLTTLAIARQLGISQAWVHKVTNTLSANDARQLGITRPRSQGHNRKALPVARIVEDYDKGRGLDPRALAKKYGVSHATIRNRLREAGVYRLLSLPKGGVSMDACHNGERR